MNRISNAHGPKHDDEKDETPKPKPSDRVKDETPDAPAEKPVGGKPVYPGTQHTDEGVRDLGRRLSK